MYKVDCKGSSMLTLALCCNREFCIRSILIALDVPKVPYNNNRRAAAAAAAALPLLLLWSRGTIYDTCSQCAAYCPLRLPRWSINSGYPRMLLSILLVLIPEFESSMGRNFKFMRENRSYIRGPTPAWMGWTVNGPSPASGCFLMAGGVVSG